jgi:hypothetical protein
MIALRSGVGGGLFPSRYLSDRLEGDARRVDEREVSAHRARLRRWWERVAASCGPATGPRALFDLAAMPLFASLGFRAVDAEFSSGAAQAGLRSRGGARVALLVLPWAARPSTAWRRAVSASADYGAAWCFVFAPPFLSLVGTGGRTVRRSIDFAFPAALGPAEHGVLMRIARSDAFDGGGADEPELDRLVRTAALFQDRVRSDLQLGVVDALAALTPIIERSSRARPGRAFDEALTILYRVLFLLFAESRDLVPCRHPIYRDAYAVGTLCRLARQPDVSRGLWEALAAVSRLSRTGCRVDDLIVRPFNGRLFARAAAPTLECRVETRRASLAPTPHDHAMQQTLIALATRETAAGRQDICYADLGVEQLGAVYERVLDLDRKALASRPRPAAGPVRKRRAARHSDRRKQSGTFYTPQDLAEFVVRRTLTPLVAGRSPDEILALRIVDPAMGSGAFLVAACHYLAAAYERALVEHGRCGDADVGPAEQAAMRRLIAERCLAGVDLNPVAVQLARLSLWLATLSEGKPLGFLDHRLRVGNTLIGASPDDLRRVTGDHARRPRDTQALPLFGDDDLQRSLGEMMRPLRALAATPSDSVDDVRAKERTWTALAGDRSPIEPWRQAANLWCARWFWPAQMPVPSAAELRAAIDVVTKGDATLRTSQVAPWICGANEAGAAHGFFHWSLEFADVFYDEAGCPRTDAGFDAVIGNPPWEMLRESRSAARLVQFVRQSGLYPSCQHGHVNLYQPFLDRALSLTRRGGRVGLVLPWGLATDDGAADLRARLLDRASLDTIVGLENSRAIFPIHRGLRFMVLVASPGGSTREIRARFGVNTPETIAALSSDERNTDLASYPVRLSHALLARAGGPMRRIPDVRQRDVLDMLDRLNTQHGSVGSPSGWNARFGRELNITEDRPHFSERGLPVLEGKHVQPFVADPDAVSFRIPRAAAARLLPSRGYTRARLAYRDVSGVSNRLSLIAAVVPPDVVTSHTLFCLRGELPGDQQHFLCGLFNSYVLNAIVRMLMGGHVTTSLVEALPVPAWTRSRAQRRIARLARRLGRRPGHRATNALLQSAVARMYELDPEAFRGVLAGFPLVHAEERALALTAFEQDSAAFAL